jgi:hypothetical protein
MSLSSWADSFIDRRVKAAQALAAGSRPASTPAIDLTAKQIDALNAKLLASEGPNGCAAAKIRQLLRLNRMG